MNHAFIDAVLGIQIVPDFQDGNILFLALLEE